MVDETYQRRKAQHICIRCCSRNLYTTVVCKSCNTIILNQKKLAKKKQKERFWETIK